MLFKWLYASNDKPKRNNDAELAYFGQTHETELKKFEELRRNQLESYNNYKNENKLLPETKPSNLHEKENKQHTEKISEKNENNLKNEKSFKQKAKEITYEWLTCSTSHGISNIARIPNKFLKFVWLICYIVSTSYCIYTIYNLIATFLSYQVLINQDYVNSPPIEFPAITVCNLNPFDRRNAQTYIDQVLKKNNISYVSDIKKIDKNPKTISNLIKASILNDRNLTSQSIRNLGFDISYMLLTCYYNDVPCNESDFVWRYEYDYTNCFTFNSGYDSSGNKVAIKKISEAGSDRSFRLELFLGDDATQSQYILNSGARVVVHNQSITPIITSEGFDISTGYQTNIGITKSVLDKLDSPYSDCIKNSRSSTSYNSELYRAMFKVLNMTTYRRKNCLRLCLQAYIKDSCGCVDGSIANIYNSSVPVCATLDALKCIENSRIKYFGSPESSSCNDCPLECDSESYQLSKSNSRYPTLYYLTYLRYHTNIVNKFGTTDQNAVSDSQITKGCVYLNVFYDDISVTYTSEQPAITGSSLLGNIGGNLGLFVGMSLLSLVEILELILLLFFAFVDSFNLNKSNSIKNSGL